MSPGVDGFSAEPPYYAVIFTSQRTSHDADGYAEMAGLMMERAALQPGFLGVDSARSEVGITVSYWMDRESIMAWKCDAEHMAAMRCGREIWYARYSIRIARVERAYDFTRSDG